jgi:hypothetical protein
MGWKLVQLNLRGSSYEIGAQQGQFLKERLQAQVPMYISQAQGIPSRWSPAQLEKIRRRSEAYMERHFPELIEEMKGIAACMHASCDVTDRGFSDPSSANTL